MSEIYSCASEQETLILADELAKRLPSNEFTVYLKGDLGAGKTTLVRGVLRALGYQAHIKSPTYTLVETYQIKGLTFHHFDLYRMEHPEELEFMGGREYFSDALCFVEWPEKGEGWLQKADLEIELIVIGNARQITLSWQNSPT